MRKILALLLVLGVLAAGFVAVGNDAAEWPLRNVEITVDMDDVLQLARNANRPPQEILTELRGRGATAVGIREAVVARYRREGLITPLQGSDILHNWRLTGEIHPALASLLDTAAVEPNKAYFLLNDRELAERLVRKAQLKLQKPVRISQSGEAFIVEVDEDVNRMLNLRVGVDPRDVEALQAVGLRAVLRPDNLFLVSEDAVRDTLADFFAIPIASAVVFDGTEVTGFPQHLRPTADAVRASGLPVGIIEFTARQAGIDRLSALTGYRTVLVHPNQARKSVQSIANSARERRARVIYLRLPLTEADALGRSLSLVEEVTAALTAHGYRGGPAQAVMHPAVQPAILLLILLGVAAAGTLLFAEVWRGEPCPLWLVLALSFAALMALFPLLAKNLALQAISLLAAVIFPSLAVVGQQLNRPVPVKDAGALRFALSALGRTFLLVAAGGAVAVALTSSPYFTGGTALFRGVKVVHTLPLLLIAPLVVLRVSYHHVPHWPLRRLARLAHELLNAHVRVVYLLAIAVLGIAGYVYIGRTGHTAGVPVPALEIAIREGLDRVLLVRPRFKEFMVGYPAALLGLALLARGHRSPLTTLLLIIGAIAPVSMSNTFMHFTTPLPFYSAFIRSVNGFWTGIIIGLVLYAAVSFILPRWEKLVKEA